MFKNKAIFAFLTFCLFSCLWHVGFSAYLINQKYNVLAFDKDGSWFINNFEVFIVISGLTVSIIATVFFVYTLSVFVIKKTKKKVAPSF